MQEVPKTKTCTVTYNDDSNEASPVVRWNDIKFTTGVAVSDLELTDVQIEKLQGNPFFTVEVTNERQEKFDWGNSDKAGRQQPVSAQSSQPANSPNPTPFENKPITPTAPPQFAPEQQPIQHQQATAEAGKAWPEPNAAPANPPKPTPVTKPKK